MQGFRDINQVIALDRAALKKGNPLAMSLEFLGLLRRLRAGRFSLLVDFQGFGETAWMSWLTGAPQRWGSVYGRGRRWAYTRGLRRNDRVHPADWDLQMLAECGLTGRTIRNEFVLPAEALTAAHDFFKENALDAGGLTLVILDSLEFQPLNHLVVLILLFSLVRPNTGTVSGQHAPVWTAGNVLIEHCQMGGPAELDGFAEVSRRVVGDPLEATGDLFYIPSSGSYRSRRSQGDGLPWRS